MNLGDHTGQIVESICHAATSITEHFNVTPHAGKTEADRAEVTQQELDHVDTNISL